MLLSEAFADFLEERFKKGVNEITLKGYWSQMQLLYDWLFERGAERVDQVKPALLLDYVSDMRHRNGLQRGGLLSPVTIRKRILFLRMFFGWVAERETGSNLAAGLEIPKAGRRLPKFITMEEIEQLLDVSRWKQDMHVTRDYAILCLMLDSGLRLSEVTALDLEDVLLDECIVHVRQGKWNQERWSVFLHETSLDLRAWLAIRHASDGELAFFVTERAARYGVGRRYTSDGLYREIKRRAGEVGLHERVSAHRLRHTLITHYLNRGGRMDHAQLLAGHEDPKTTMGYNWVALVPVQREHEKLSPLRGLRKAV